MSIFASVSGYHLCSLLLRLRSHRQSEAGLAVIESTRSKTAIHNRVFSVLLFAFFLLKLKKTTHLLATCMGKFEIFSNCRNTSKHSSYELLTWYVVAFSPFN